MVLSMFNQLQLQLRCHRSHIEEVVLSRLDKVTSWPCRECGDTIDLTAEPYATTLRQQRELATELDKQASQKGQVVEWLD